MRKPASVFSTASISPVQANATASPSRATSDTRGTRVNASASAGTSARSTGRARPRRRDCARTTDNASTARTEPSRSRATLEAICSTSAMTWLDSKIEVPADCRSATSAANSRCNSGSSPLVGSSSTSKSTSGANTSTSPSFCLLPFDSSWTRRDMSSSNRSASSRTRTGSNGGRAAE